jgi:DHA2 family multidrug resistance protein
LNGTDQNDLDTLAAALTPAQRHLILMTVSVTAMLHMMAMTSVSVVLPQMRGSLSAGPDQISWVLTLSVIGAVVATPLSGWMVDRLGWRKVTLITIAGFALSTILCASAQTLTAMLIARTLQGAFGAPLIVVAQAILLAVYPKEDAAWSQSAWGIASVVGQAMAPVIGGYLADALGWRWAIWFLIPMSLISIIMTLIWIPNGGATGRTRFDWIGFVGLSLAVASLQMTMDRGERLYWFESTEIISYTVLSITGALVFLGRCITQTTPFIDLSLFKNLRFCLGVFMIMLFGMASFMPNWILPAIMGGLQGYPQATIGWVLWVRGLGMLFGFFLVAAIAGPYPRATMGIGFLLAALAGFQGIFFTLSVSYEEIAWVSGIQGFGTALMWTPIVLIGFSGLSPSQMAQGSALFHLLRQLSMSVFLAVMVSVSVRTGTISYAELIAQLDLFVPGSQPGSPWDFESTTGLAQISAEVARQSKMIGYNNAFLVYTVACAIGAALAFFCFPRSKIGTT